MVLKHVAHDTRLVIIAAAGFDADGFRRRDLHVVDIAAVPDGLEYRVGKTQHHDVLHGLFAEIMIDAIDLFFVERSWMRRLNSRAVSRSVPNGFSMITRVRGASRLSLGASPAAAIHSITGA